MSFWGRSSSAAKPNAPRIRVEKIAVKSSPGKITKVASRSQTQGRPGPSRHQPYPPPKPSTLDSNPSGSAHLKPHKQSNPRKRSPVFQRIESDSSDDGESALEDFPSKRPKLTTHGAVDQHRRLRAQQASSGGDGRLLIHAADIASQKLGFAPAFTSSEGDTHVIYLQYPGDSQRERYELVFRYDCFNPVEEIIEVVKDFTDFFLTTQEAQPFQHPESGIIRRLERAKNLKSLADFKSALENYNAEVDVLRQDGTIAKCLDQKHSLPEKLVIRIMTQTYDRAVSPKVDLLKKYENGTDEIYGELKANLVFNILVETQMTSDQVFVDLGSGVANVVLQAALQIGCESWGCEIMENACTLAEAQKVEFLARCRLWGIAPGAIKLERGDFMKSDNIREAIKRADVVLVNNEVFTPELNNDLVNLFLDLKEGCKVVSLKSFVPANHKIRSYNLNNPVNLLDVERKRYSTKSVSWKDDGGYYFIATKDSKRLQSYEEVN